MAKLTRTGAESLQRLAASSKWPQFDALAATLIVESADDLDMWSYLANVRMIDSADQQ